MRLSSCIIWKTTTIEKHSIRLRFVNLSTSFYTRGTKLTFISCRGNVLSLSRTSIDILSSRSRNCNIKVRRRITWLLCSKMSYEITIPFVLLTVVTCVVHKCISVFVVSSNHGYSDECGRYFFNIESFRQSMELLIINIPANFTALFSLFVTLNCNIFI